MPVQRGKSWFDFNKALQSHAMDETTYQQDFTDLPGDITGGVAKLIDAKRGEYKTGPNQGQKYLYLAGTVISPKRAAKIVKIWDLEKKGVKILSAEEVVIEGQRTSLTLPLCETKTKDGKVTPGDDNVATALNEIRKLGGKDCLEGVSTEQEFDDFLKQLLDVDNGKKNAPLFRFSTRSKEPTKDYPNSGVWPHNWQGTQGLENFSTGDGQASDAVQDRSGESSTQAQGDGDDGDKATASGENEDLDALVTAADDKDDADAQERLKTLAEEAGVPNEKVKKADNWAAVAEMIREAQGGGGDEPEKQEKPDAPSKNENYWYKPKGQKKLTEFEVLDVNKKNKTVDLRSLDDNKVKPKAVPWSDLKDESGDPVFQ